MYICTFSLQRRQFASRVDSPVGEGAVRAQCRPEMHFALTGVWGESSKWARNNVRGSGNQNTDEAPDLKGSERSYSNKNQSMPPSKTQMKEISKNQGVRLACEVCGLKNHSVEDCRRKLFCELCGFANHVTLDCKR